jgi:hypothetical protein
MRKPRCLTSSGELDIAIVGLLDFRDCPIYVHIDSEGITVMANWGELENGEGVRNLAVFERLTYAARRALDFAWHETLHRGGVAISASDLLAGLSEEDNTRAERIGSLKANAFYIRWLVGLPALPAQEVAIDGREAKIGEASWDLDPEARRAFAFAIVEADRDRNYWIDSDHLLRGILRFPNKAHFALLKIEVSLKSARIASRIDRVEYLPEENPSLKVVKYLVRKYAALLVPSALSLACYLYILMEGIGMTTSPVAR